MAYSLIIGFLMLAPTQQMAEPDTAKMSLQEVRAFNATVDASHPYFIKCRPVQKTGSLARRGHACRTSERWRQLGENGNSQARTLVEESTTRPSGQ